MAATKEYWDYARECAQWAVEAKDQLEKDHFLDMAKAWTELALLEAGLINGNGGRVRAQTEAAIAANSAVAIRTRTFLRDPGAPAIAVAIRR